MLKLYRMHLKDIEEYSEIECTTIWQEECVLEWCIGDFKSLMYIEKYLVDYHNYKKFDVSDYRKILITLGKTGHCYLPCWCEQERCEETDDGCKVEFYIEKV